MALPERIAAYAARQGGFSTVNLPRPLEVQWDGSFVFLPTKTGDTWQVIGGDGTYDVDVYTVQGSDPALVANGGPYGGADAIRFVDDAWVTMTSFSDDYTPSSSAAGITLEFYGDFGPNGSLSPGSSSQATLQCFLATSATLEGSFAPGYPHGPFFHLGAACNASPSGGGGDLGSYIQVYGRWTSNTTIFSTESSQIMFPVQSQDPAIVNEIGYKHYACEFYRDGRIRLYYEGVLIYDDFRAVPPSEMFDGMDCFIPCWYVAALTTAERPRGDFHGVRYSPFIRYNGGNFTPPQL